MYSFSLTCTNWFQSETLDFMLSDGQGVQPRYYRRQNIKAGSVFTFNNDTCGWQWCQYDFFAILNKNGQIDQKWQLRIREYAPGECPECHGTHQCSHCRGQGVWVDLEYGTGIKTCSYCMGTGVCGTCYIPRRVSQPSIIGSNYSRPVSTANISSSHRRIADIQNDIQFAQMQLDRAEKNYEWNKINGLYSDSYIMQQNEINLIYNYRRRLLDLQEELRRATS